MMTDHALHWNALQWRKKETCPNLPRTAGRACLCVFVSFYLSLSVSFDLSLMSNDDKWWQMMTENEEKKKPVQISPEQLVGLVGEGHFAIRDNCRKHCQNINIWEWNEILSKNHMWYMYHPYFNLERCDSQPPAWWEQPTIAATSWQHLNVNTIFASELLTLFEHQNFQHYLCIRIVNTICASEFSTLFGHQNVNTICASAFPPHQISVKSVQSVTHSHPTSWHEGDNCLESFSDFRWSAASKN